MGGESVKAKDFLLNYGRQKRMLNCKRDTLQDLVTLATSVTASYESERVQSSGAQDKIAVVVSRIVDLQNEITDDIVNIVNELEKITRMLEQLDGDEYEVLYLRYIKLLQWDDVAIRMNKAPEYVRGKLHGDALSSLQKIL